METVNNTSSITNVDVPDNANGSITETDLSSEEVDDSQLSNIPDDEQSTSDAQQNVDIDEADYEFLEDEDDENDLEVYVGQPNLPVDKRKFTAVNKTPIVAATPTISVQAVKPSVPVGIDIDDQGDIQGHATTDFNLSFIRDEDKPWKLPGSDITDYFNYGFTEDTWTLYCEKQRSIRQQYAGTNLKPLMLGALSSLRIKNNFGPHSNLLKTVSGGQINVLSGSPLAAGKPNGDIISTGNKTNNVISSNNETKSHLNNNMIDLSSSVTENATFNVPPPGYRNTINLSAPPPNYANANVNMNANLISGIDQVALQQLANVLSGQTGTMGGQSLLQPGLLPGQSVMLTNQRLRDTGSPDSVQSDDNEDGDPRESSESHQHIVKDREFFKRKEMARERFRLEKLMPSSISGDEKIHHPLPPPHHHHHVVRSSYRDSSSSRHDSVSSRMSRSSRKRSKSRSLSSSRDHSKKRKHKDRSSRDRSVTSKDKKSKESRSSSRRHRHKSPSDLVVKKEKDVSSVSMNIKNEPISENVTADDAPEEAITDVKRRIRKSDS